MINFMKWMGIISLVFLAGCPEPSNSDTDDKTGGSSELGVNLVMSISSTDEVSNKFLPMMMPKWRCFFWVLRESH